jgi:hypothetical protein
MRALFRAKTIAFKFLGFGKLPAFLNLKITQNRALLEMENAAVWRCFRTRFLGEGFGKKKRKASNNLLAFHPAKLLGIIIR